MDIINYYSKSLLLTYRVYCGLVHTETFSCVFVLFDVLKGIENNQLITSNNTKTQENISVCTGTVLARPVICFIILNLNKIYSWTVVWKQKQNNLFR